MNRTPFHDFVLLRFRADYCLVRINTVCTAITSRTRKMEGDDNNQATNSGDSPDDPSSSSKSFNIDDQFETIRNAVNRAEMREGDTW